ncbi:MAG: hypothetical protein IKP16_08555 [Prevotella sp.]|nr:hypothetical protein [Prevotella sp.]
MKKELYLKPTLKLLAVKDEELLAAVSVSDEEIGEGFEEGAKQGFSSYNGSLPRAKNVWDEEF